MKQTIVQLEPVRADHAEKMLFFPKDTFFAALAPGAHFFAVKDGDNYVGLVGVRNQPNPLPEALVIIDPAEHGKGYGTAAIVAILDVSFETLKFEEVYAGCRPGSTSSRIAEKLGFKKYAHRDGSDFYVIRKVDWKK